MAQKITLQVNGVGHDILVDDPDMPLLYALRDDIGLNNPRLGCGLGQCGACTVHLNGVPVRSCSLPVSAVGASKITTLHGLGIARSRIRCRRPGSKSRSINAAIASTVG